MSKERILITEDEIVVAEDLRATLSGLGYTVVGVASSRLEAVSMVAETRPHLVLMDIHLRGDEDGILAATDISNQFSIPVIFLTAHADQATLTRATAVGPFGYIVKPFEEHGLRASIETALRLQEARTAMNRMERWLTTTLRSIGDAVVSVDRAGRITFLNPRAEQITGWTHVDAVGRLCTEIAPLLDEGTRGPVENPTVRAMSLGVQVNLAERTLLVTRGGQEVPIADSAAPLREKEGEITGSVWVFRDITLNRQQSAERDRLQVRMQEAQRLESLGLVAGGVAHDFNNLLTAVLGNSQLARTSLPPDSPAVPFLRAVDEAAGRAADLCHQMLEYAGRQETVFVSIDMNSVVLETVRLIRAALSPNAEIVLQLEPLLPAVHADRTQLQQVVMNLIFNASEALSGQSGTITISTSLATVDHVRLRNAVLGEGFEPGRYVQLEVRDTGSGMTAETMARIFDPFFTTKFTGRGLGLASVHGISRAHRAPLFVQSRLGAGSTFTVMIPVAAVEEKIEAAVARRPGVRAEGAVLIVEDEPAVRMIVTRIVERLGLEALAAAGGPDAVNAVAGCRPEPRLILLDVNMPGMDGFATLQALRKMLPSTPVVLVSALPEEAALERFSGEKIAGVLRKPFRPDQLERKIAEVLT